MPHYETLFPNRFTKAITLENPLTIRILSVGGEKLLGDDGEKSKGIMKYRCADGEAELVLAKVNAALIAAILGTPDIAQWPGHTVTIKNDPTVMFGSEKVGGIRVCGSPELKKPLRVEVKRPRRKKPEVYVLQPTDAQGRVKGTAPAQSPTPDEPPPHDPDAPGAERESAP